MFLISNIILKTSSFMNHILIAAICSFQNENTVSLFRIP